MGKDQHVVPHNEKWAVRGAGNDKVTSIHDTQKDAISAVRQIAQNQKSEVVIHRPNGTYEIKIVTVLTLILPKIKSTRIMA